MMVTVRTQYGVISGIKEENGIYAFLGIPYAAAPVGDLRFRPPQPPAAWEGIRHCDSYGPPSLQLLTANHVTTAEKLSISSEDSLYLNVRTRAPLMEKEDGSGEMVPDPDTGMPVYVFIHGGAFETGGSNMKLYEGQSFAEDGIVYVNINYRLGIFGALALDSLREEAGVTGCYHILDIMQAVKWVHDNIHEFGGDPDNITIGGESAGAFSISVLMCMPEMKGMFRRCILESGSIRAAATSVSYGHGNPDIAVKKGREVIGELGLSDTAEDLERLRQVPAEELLDRWSFREDGTLRPGRSNPVLDGLLFDGDRIPDPRLQPPSDIDLLFGFNTDEGSMFAPADLTIEGYIEELKNMFPESWEIINDAYPADADHSPYSRLADIYGLQKFKGSMLPYADELSSRGMNVYAYHFDHMTERLRKEGLGVRHIAELPFVFGKFLSTVGADDENGRMTSEKMHDAWVGFIRNGIPGPDWKPYDTGSCLAMRFFSGGCVMEKISRLEEMRFFDDQL